MMKKTLAMITAAVSLAASLAITSFAAGWFQDGNGWRWYNDDGSVITGGWHWLDGNGDGISESYCFNEAGYIYQNTVTPDNYTVNADGAWTVNGVVQTRQTGTSTLRPATPAAAFQQTAEAAAASGQTVQVTADQVTRLANMLADDLYVFRKNNRTFGTETNRSDLNYDQIVKLMQGYGRYISDPRINASAGPAFVSRSDASQIMQEAFGKSGTPALKRMDDSFMTMGDQYVLNYLSDYDGDFIVDHRTLQYSDSNGMLAIRADVTPTKDSEEGGYFIAYFTPSGRQALYGYTFERIELIKYK